MDGCTRRWHQWMKYCMSTRQLQILHGRFNDVFLILLLTITAGQWVIIIICVYAGVRFDGALRFFMILVGAYVAGFLVTILMAFGEVNELSKRLLTLIHTTAVVVLGVERSGDKSTHVLIKRHMRSLRDIRVQVGSLYFVDKPIIMTTCQIIFENTIGLLMSFWGQDLWQRMQTAGQAVESYWKFIET